MRRPRVSFARLRGGILSRSSPAKRIVPPAVRAFLAMVPRIAFARVVLPQPDSPTSPMISPGLIARLTPSSTWASPASVANDTRRRSTSRRLSPGDATTDPWIEDIAQAVTQEIEAHHDEEDGEARRQRGPPRFRQELARLRDHAPPFGGRRRRTETEEAERTGSQDGKAHADGGAHNDRRHYVRQHVQQDDPPGRHAQRDRRLD